MIGADGGPALTTVWADPGVTTGWSVHRVSIAHLLAGGQVAAMDRMWWRLGQFKCGSTSESVDAFLALCRAAWEKSGEEDVVVFGSESFSLRMQSSDPDLLEPVRFNAVLDDRLREAGIRVERQAPSDAKNVVTDVRLRLWGVYQAGAQHARDAQRHGLLFCRRFATDEALRKRVGWGT